MALKPGTRGAWSNWRRWAILLGALILFAAVFDLVERLVAVCRGLN